MIQQIMTRAFLVRLTLALSCIASSSWVVWREVQRALWALEHGIDVGRYRAYHPSVDTLLPWSIGIILMLLAMGRDCIGSYSQRPWPWDWYLSAVIVLGGTYGWMLGLVLQRAG